ncbi:MAG: rhodanese-like domain-containing protein [Deltaproteobacteria bacterium]|nr:rhodanese-like domain-containing protein [Deltaproteobacteria bacterium]
MRTVRLLTVPGRLGLALGLTIGLTIGLGLGAAGCSKEADAPPASPRPAPPADGTATQPAPSTPRAKDPARALSLIASGATVIDVRTPEEFEGGHVARAVNLPVDGFAGRLAEVERLLGGDKSRPVVVYCASGRRSGIAQQQLEAAGYTQVINGGGFDDLQ